MREYPMSEDIDRRRRQPGRLRAARREPLRPRPGGPRSRTVPGGGHPRSSTVRLAGPLRWPLARIALPEQRAILRRHPPSTSTREEMRMSQQQEVVLAGR